MVTTNTMDKAYLVDRTQMAELPMNGRNFTSLMNTIPGMSSAAQSDFNVNFNDVSQFHSLGGRGSENNFYLDGSPNIDVGDNQSQYTQASIDTIAEFRVLQSGFNAEYGRNSGMVIAVQTKSGSEQIPRHRIRILPQQRAGCQMRVMQHAAAATALQPVRRQFQRLGADTESLDQAEQATLLLLQPGDDAPQPSRQQLRGRPQRERSERKFQPVAASTNMKYAPQFKNGTVFQPGTLTRDGSGNITGGIPFPNNVVPQSMWQPMSSAPC